jgi:hypothetical protein
MPHTMPYQKSTEMRRQQEAGGDFLEILAHSVFELNAFDHFSDPSHLTPIPHQ